MLTFFCYCALESTAGLWAASFLVLGRGVDEETAAGWASLFYIGITVGRFLNGFLTARLSDRKLISLGAAVAALGAVTLLLPLGRGFAVAGLVLTGLGCAPVYPCMIHCAPVYFGPDRSQSVIGVQMAAAYLGTTLVPPLFGAVASHISLGLYPPALLLLTLALYVGHRAVMARLGPDNEA